MSLVYRFTTLDDAYAFLLQAKGLPAVVNTADQLQRCVRACILISWIAVEEGLEHAVQIWTRNGRLCEPLPSGLEARLSAVLAAIARPPFNGTEYREIRKIRNELTHPKVKSVETTLAVQSAQATFEFCAGIVRALLPFQVECRA